MESDKSKTKDSADKTQDLEKQSNANKQLLVVLSKQKLLKDSRNQEISRVYSSLPKRTQSLSSIKFSLQKTPLENLNLSRISQNQPENEADEDDMSTFKHQEFSFKPKNNNKSSVYLKSPKTGTHTSQFSELSPNSLAQRIAIQSPFKNRIVNPSNQPSPKNAQNKLLQTDSNLMKFPVKSNNRARYASQNNSPRENSLVEKDGSHNLQQEKPKPKPDAIIFVKKKAQDQNSSLKSPVSNRYNQPFGQVVLRKASLPENSETLLALKPTGDIADSTRQPIRSPASHRLQILRFPKQISVPNLNPILIQSSVEVQQDPVAVTVKARPKQKFSSFEEEVGHIARSALYMKATTINYSHLMKKTFDRRIDLRQTRSKFSEIYEKEAKKNGSSEAFKEKIAELFNDNTNSELQHLISDFDKYKNEKKQKRRSTLKGLPEGGSIFES